MAIASDIRKTLTDPGALYAVAGAGDLAVEKLRTVPTRAMALPTQALLLPVKAQDVVLDAVVDLGGRAGGVYGDLAVRGKSVVRRIRRQKAGQELQETSVTTVRRTKATTAAAKKSATETRTAAKSTARSARKTAASAAKAVEDGAGKIG